MDIVKVNSDNGLYTYEIKDQEDEYVVVFDEFILNNESRKYHSYASLEPKSKEYSVISSHERIHVRRQENESFNINLKTGNFFFHKTYEDGTSVSVENDIYTILYPVKPKLIDQWLRTIRRKS